MAWQADIHGQELRPLLLRTTGSALYEWTDEPVIPFLTRLQAALAADPTLAAYNTKVLVMADRQLSRFDAPKVFTHDKGHVIVIHSARESFAQDTSEASGGKEDLLLHCEVMAVVKTAKSIDATTLREVGLMGDTSRVGVVQMQADIRAVLWNNGKLNLLPSSGVDYLWNLDIGEAPVQVYEDEKSHYLTASRPVTGHKWLVW